MLDENFWQEYKRANSNPITRFINNNKIEQMEKEIIDSSDFVSKNSPDFEKWSSEINLVGINLEGIALRENYLEKQYSILSNASFYSAEKLSELKEDLKSVSSEREANQEVFDILELDNPDYLSEGNEFSTTTEQASLLPDGWIWQIYQDGSGYLNTPEGEEYDRYDYVREVEFDVENFIREKIEQGTIQGSKASREGDLSLDVNPAESLPEGWDWHEVRYSNGFSSGFLESPVGTKYAHFERDQERGISYRNLEDGGWGRTSKDFSEYKIQSETEMSLKISHQDELSKATISMKNNAPTVEIFSEESPGKSNMNQSNQLER